MHYVFRLLRESGVAAERFFAAPYPYRSVDADTMLERFPIITAGISYEGDVETFLKWLHNAGIPLSQEERARGGFPIVAAGGALTYINPLVLSAFCDFIYLGDALDVLKETIPILRDYRTHGSMERLLADLDTFASILVPALDFEKERLAAKKKIDVSQPLTGDYPMHSTWVTPHSAFGDTVLVELQRGCARNCSYCTLGCFGKMRQRKLEEIEAPLRSLFKRIDVEQVGLVTPEAGDYAQLDPLLDLLQQESKGVSFASLRVDRLSENMLRSLTRGGRHSITIAPETANEALRFSFGKKFTDDLILEKLSLAREFGVDQVKLYFMIGLPGERDEDVAAIADLCKRIVAATDQNLIVSAGPFVPKPGTVWQQERFLTQGEIRKKYDILTKETRKFGRKAPQLRLTSPKEAEREYLLTWAGYEKSAALAKNVQSGKKASFTDGGRAETLLELSCLY